MGIDRRALIAGLLSSGVVRIAPSPAGQHRLFQENAGQKRQYFAAARRLRNGAFEGAVFDDSGQDIATVVLPSRGHDVAVRQSTGECVVFARRPGTFAIAFHRPAKLPPLTFKAAPARHFYGHGVFGADGRLLFTTENDYANDRGIIGVRDATNGYRQIGEYLSHGVGPHDIAMLSDGRTLVVANGGISTHPEEGRRMLNVSSMQPNLTYIDAHTGELLETHALADDLHKVSIRHLAVTPEDNVVFGCQFVGPKSEVPMLVGTHRRQQPVALVEAPSKTYGRLRNYVSSIATDRSGRFAMATSAKGSMALLIDLEKRLVVRELPLADVSGVARGANATSFILSSGEGTTHVLPGADSAPRQLARHDYAWDNHAVSLL